MCLNNHRSQDIWQAISNGFKDGTRSRGAAGASAFSSREIVDDRRGQISKKDVGNILSRKNSSQVGG